MSSPGRAEVGHTIDRQGQKRRRFVYVRDRNVYYKTTTCVLALLLLHLFLVAAVDCRVGD